MFLKLLRKRSLYSSFVHANDTNAQRIAEHPEEQSLYVVLDLFEGLDLKCSACLNRRNSASFACI